MSISTIGESAASDASGFFHDGKFVFDTPVGNSASIGPDGLKPSQRFIDVGSIGTASMFFGIASMSIFTRRPVAVVASGTSNAADGHGNRQP